MRPLPVLLVLGVAGALLAPSTAASASPTWLCRPGLARNPCAAGLATTVLSPTGAKIAVQRPHARRAIDCFYVYPTVSDQPTPIANRRIDPELRSIARYQAARYASLCRVFAPVYRQRTIAGIQPGATGGPRRGVVNTKGFQDVLAAWRTYLRRDNHGRGVVLIGHSQGAFVLRKLIAEQIDRRPSVRRRLVSAVLLGGNVEIRRGSDRGGDFRHIPACRFRRQVGCVLAFSTFDETPPPGALFGRTLTPGRKVLCTNPAALRGGSAAVRPIFPSAPFAPATAIAAGIQILGLRQPPASTPWETLVGGFRARCANEAGASFLKLTAVRGAPDFRPSPTPGWGLHLADANIALGNLVDLVGTQSAAYAAR
jgi:Protein of unknown function (DUF3089)